MSNKSDYVTKEYLDKTLQEMTDAILTGMDTISKNLNNKIDHIEKNMATKEDLKREIGWLKDDIAGINTDLATHKHPSHLYSN